MNVAVPAVQHSPMFGHRALWQTVWSSCVSMISTRFLYVFPYGSLTRNQSGLRTLSGAVATASTTGNSTKPGSPSPVALIVSRETCFRLICPGRRGVLAVLSFSWLVPAMRCSFLVSSLLPSSTRVAREGLGNHDPGQIDPEPGRSRWLFRLRILRIGCLWKSFRRCL